MKILSPLCLLLCCLLPLPAGAIQVVGLYEVEVPVIDQSDRTREAGLATALRLALVKLTGDRQAAARSALAPLLTQAKSFLQQYRYREVSIEQTDVEGAKTTTVETRLWVKFDEDNLNQALRKLGVAVWGSERPSTLVWLVVEDADGRRLVGMEDGAEYVNMTEQRAVQRGVTLIYPLLDLDDSSALRASDVWGGFRQPVLDASARYHADAILAGAIESPVPGIWEGRWTVYMGQQTISWNSESVLLAAVLEEGVDKLVDILAAQFARSTVSPGINQVRLVVADIFNVDQYASVLAYLSSLNSVTDVEVTRVESGRVTYLLQAHGGELAISQAIELGRLLAPIGNSDSEYRLLP